METAFSNPSCCVFFLQNFSRNSLRKECFYGDDVADIEHLTVNVSSSLMNVVLDEDSNSEYQSDEKMITQTVPGH